MSVTQAMEWLIEHADDPSVDAPLPGSAPAEAPAEGAASSAEAAAGPSSEEGGEEAKDELTEIFKKIRRKREFRPDPRVGAADPLWGLWDWEGSHGHHKIQMFQMEPLGRWVLCWLGSVSVEMFRECLNSGILPQECISVWDSRIYMKGTVTSAPGKTLRGLT